MDSVELLLKAATPNTLIGKIGLFSGFGLLGVAISYYPFQWLVWHYEIKYRKTVCWKEYKTVQQAYLLPEIYSRREYNRRNYAYFDCINKARSAAK